MFILIKYILGNVYIYVIDSYMLLCEQKNSISTNQ